MNSSFSKVVPNLQLAWDSTSLEAAQRCPRYYQLSIVEGYEPRLRSVHLDFGIWMHEAKEHYDRARARGEDHEDAVRGAVCHVMLATWNKELGRPWTSDDPNKTRFSLVRSVVWYFEEYKEDPIQTVVFANGTPAVELSFSFQTNWCSQATGEPFLLCGHMDRIGKLGDHTYVCDVKTSKHLCDERWLAGFSPGMQFSMYTFASKIIYNLPTHGLIVDGIQVAVTFSRPTRGLVQRTETQLAEWYKDVEIIIREAESYARESYWPMRTSSCGNYGGCQFRRICSRPPAAREQWLRSDFLRRTWDPLQVRGDI